MQDTVPGTAVELGSEWEEDERARDEAGPL